MSKPVLWTRDASGLVKQISPIYSLILSVAFGIGVGAHQLTIYGTYWYPGCDMVFSSVLISVLFVFVSLPYVWLVLSMPGAGGDYVFISRLLSPSIGYACTFAYFIAAAMTIGFNTYVAVETFGLFVRQIGSTLGSNYWMNIGFILGNDTTTKLMLAIVLGPVLTTVIGMFGLRASKWALYLLVALPVLFAIPMLGGLSSMANPAITQPLWDKTYGAGSFQGIVDLAHKSGFQDSTFAPSFSSNATIVAMTAPGWAASGVWSNTPRLLVSLRRPENQSSMVL